MSLCYNLFIYKCDWIVGKKLRKQVSKVNNMIPDPDCESFCGLYAGGPSEILPPSEYDLGKLAKYLKARKRKYTQLTSEELEKFKININ